MQVDHYEQWSHLQMIRDIKHAMNIMRTLNINSCSPHNWCMEIFMNISHNGCHYDVVAYPFKLQEFSLSILLLVIATFSLYGPSAILCLPSLINVVKRIDNLFADAWLWENSFSAASCVGFIVILSCSAVDYHHWSDYV